MKTELEAHLLKKTRDTFHNIDLEEVKSMSETEFITFLLKLIESLQLALDVDSFALLYFNELEKIALNLIEKEKTAIPYVGLKEHKIILSGKFLNDYTSVLDVVKMKYSDSIKDDFTVKALGNSFVEEAQFLLIEYRKDPIEFIITPLKFLSNKEEDKDFKESLDNLLSG